MSTPLMTRLAPATLRLGSNMAGATDQPDPTEAAGKVATACGCEYSGRDRRNLER